MHVDDSRPGRPRPDGVTDAEVEALGTLSEALEWVERARGRLYDFHQLSGHADLLLGEPPTSSTTRAEATSRRSCVATSSAAT